MAGQKKNAAISARVRGDRIALQAKRIAEACARLIDTEAVK